MDFNSFLTHLSKVKSAPLGGRDSQFKMVPALRLNFTEESILQRNPKESAVMALFYPDKAYQTRFLLILRPNYNGTHSAQISFPGGKKDDNDANLIHTALRETEEEVGINREEITLYRELTKTYIPPSNFWVTPYIGYLEKQPVFTTNDEVDQLIEVSFSDLLHDKSLSSKNLTTSYMKNIDVPCFLLNDYVVWGATAMILSEIKDLLKTL
ncbi:MAG: CoA pyrophosphatase [Flavobacteriaceae bacterium]|nr:CoA pyrophosphatase [Flavobacteriaceae bacterium]